MSGEWSQGCNINQVAVTVWQLADLIFLRWDKLLSVSALKGFCLALNHIFHFGGLGIASLMEIAILMRNFENSCHHQEIRFLVGCGVSSAELCLSPFLTLSYGAG